MGVMGRFGRLVLLVCASCVALTSFAGCAGTSRSAGSGDGFYVFEDAGFEAWFPEKPKEEVASGILFNERETFFVGSDGHECVLVAKGRTPDPLADFLAKGPADEAKANSLGQNLDILAYGCGHHVGLKDIAFDGIALSNYNEASSYSGLASFSARLDSGESDSDGTVMHCCCGVVCNGSALYTILAVCDDSDKSIRAARSFTLLNSVES